MKYTWLLFDADETLFDFSRAEANALRWTLEQSGLEYHPEYVALYARFNQQVWKEFERGEVTSAELRTKRFKLFFDELGLQRDLPATSLQYLHYLSLGTDLLEGADKLLHDLKPQVRMALVTNGLKEVQRPRLANSSIKDCFEHIFISEELGAAKPSAAFFDTVFATLGQPARTSTLIIGDSLSSDIKGGIAYGIDTCWYNPHSHHTDLPVTYQISQLDQLPKLLE